MLLTVDLWSASRVASLLDQAVQIAESVPAAS
jgi:hypothetical protein